PFVLRIARQSLTGWLARLLIRRREENQLVHLFDAPAPRDEFAREPVEQFRVCRRFGAGAELARRRNNAATEMMLPNPIHDYARGKRVVGAGHPIREGGSAVFCDFKFEIWDFGWRENLREARLHFFAGIVVIAAGKD